MSEPTLLEDLEESARHLDAHGRTTLAARLRAAATRLREALVHAERQCGDGRGCTCCVDALAALRAVNGRPSPPITHGSPGGHECPSCDLDDSVKVPPGKLLKSTPIKVPASPPTTPTCAMCNGRHVVPTSCPTMTEGCLVAHFGPCPTCGPLHPRTP